MQSFTHASLIHSHTEILTRVYITDINYVKSYQLCVWKYSSVMIV